MHIVRGVVHLIRRSSIGHTPESGVGSSSRRFLPPSPEIHFSEIGDEAILSTLWGKYINAFDKVERQKFFLMFLKQFLIVYKNWKPIDLRQSSEAASCAFPPVEYSQHDDVIFGCSAGHPAEITLALTEELTHIIAMVFEFASSNTSGVISTTERLGTVTSLTLTSEGVPILAALTIVTRSMHNCNVFGYYGGIQKVTALMKAAVVQLKTITSALSEDESLSESILEKIAVLQNLLRHVVLIICSFINLHSDVYEISQPYFNFLELSFSKGGSNSFGSSGGTTAPSEARAHWHQKAVVSVIEAGGVNWLVELLHVMRRFSIKEQQTDMALLCLTLTSLRSTLANNPRGQNHFRSIGGLEVLLDGLGFPSINILESKNSSISTKQRGENAFEEILLIHVLSFEVLRESVFGNSNNLQFLCENGRIDKFANSFCAPAFMLQEYKQQRKDLSVQDNLYMLVSDAEHDNNIEFHGYWNDYVVKLSRVLFSFLLALEDVYSHDFQSSAGETTLPVSSVYGELSAKWIVRVLFTVFPCVEACSNQNQLPKYLRLFVYVLHHHFLFVLRKVLILSPSLLDVFRSVGVWDFIFSKNYFYFGPVSADCAANYSSYSGILPWNYESNSDFNFTDHQVNNNEIEILQIEVISLLEFAATLTGNAHNLPECSVLLDALEHSACNPEITGSIARCLLRIYQTSAEKTAASFKSLDAIPRVLKVACIQVHESKRTDRNYAESRGFEKSASKDIVQIWHASLETCMELFGKYFSATEDARSLILHSSSCIDCLFELFWEEDLRDRVLAYILDLMKIIPLADKDQTAELYLCSKYLETFTHVKERERSCSELSIKLLLGMSGVLLSDQRYYQALFRDGECFLHVVSLLHANLEEENGEKLVLSVLETLTCLLTNNDASKDAFRALVGKGYLTLQSLLLDFCQWRPSEGLLNALLDMLVDGKFDIKTNSVIKNEDVILLYLSVLQKSSDSSRHHGLNLFLQLLKESISNRASCVKAGTLNFLIDWFSQEEDDGVVLKLAQLIQVTGGHSISGKDIRKIFALLRSEKVGSGQQYCSLLLTSILSMLNEKGPTAFFDLNGYDSGIIIKTPVHWPLYKGFSISCWLRVENFPRNGTMGLFRFLTENGRGCLAALTKDKLLYESVNQKRKFVSLNVNLVVKKWQFLCLTHSIGRAFSGGSQVRCYVDGVLVSSEKCSYAKVNDTITSCSIGTKVDLPSNEDENAVPCIKDSSPFFGQIGPIYMFSEPLSSEQVQGMYSLGPSYMYSFLDNKIAFQSDNPLSGRILDAKDGLASKITFGINAQACNGRTLFNVSPMLGHAIDRKSFEATVMTGTQLCSRRLLQQIIYCVGGVSVFFPLFTRFELYENEESEEVGHSFLIPTRKQRLTAEFIELIASVLDENLVNQQQMLRLSGFSILGILLQSVPPQKLNLETLSALKYLYNVVANCGLSEMLTEDALSHIFLNPFIWVFTVYNVQRELYMFLIQQFDNDPRLLQSLCRLPRVLDIIRQFYWENPKSRSSIGGKPLLHPIADQDVGERPSKEEVHRIRLLLLSLGEMSLRQSIAVTDINALIAFFETSQDMGCIEDVLHMVIRAVSQKQLLASFLEQINLISGCHMFVNLLERDYEPIRLLGLQFIGKLLVGLPSHKKALKFFSITMGRSKSLSDSHKKLGLRILPIFSVISDKLFKFPQTNNLCATLFVALLGGASPEQVLQKHDQFEGQRGRIKKPQFFLPQILPLIFRFLSGCESVTTRIKIIEDILDLLDMNPSNIEALMDNGWNAWLVASVKLDVLQNYKRDSRVQGESEMSEQTYVRKLFCVVLRHCMQSIKGGWQHLEETAIFLLMHSEQDGISYQYLLRDIYEDLVQRLIELSSEDDIFLSQPCRDNTLYLLKLVDDLLISEIDAKLPFPASLADFSTDSLELDSHKDLGSALYDALNGEYDGQQSSNTMGHAIAETDMVDEEWWNIYDKLWIIIREMHGKGPRKLRKSSSAVGASFGQRARGLVESLNIPAAEMAAAVVSGGISNALVGKTNKIVDKAMLLRQEKCPRIAYRLVVVYLCKSSLARCFRCVQLVIPILPNLLTAGDEQSKSRLQLFIWSLLAVRKQYGMLDDGARFHVITDLLLETVNHGKSMLATSLAGRDDSSDSSSNPRESGAINNLIQKDRVLSAVSDEVKYVKTSKIDEARQLHDLRTRMDENMLSASSRTKSFEDEMQNSLNEILASDDSRRASFQLAYDEGQQIVADKWIHTLRTLIDERGPWSATPFPNSSIAHWKLDKTEDAWRRRQKLRQNYHFDNKLCHPPSSIPSTEGSLVDESKFGFGSHIPEQMKQFLLKGIRSIADEGSSETIENEAESSLLKASASEDHLDKALKDGSNQKNNALGKKEPSLVATEAEPSEVLMSVPCVLVTPRRKLAGNLAVMKNFLHFFGEFLVEGTGGSSVFDNLNTSGNFDASEPDQPGVKRKFLISLDLNSGRGNAIDSMNATHGSGLQNQTKTIKRHRRWNIFKIKAVHWTRYLLRYRAIEIFFDNSVAPVFFNFASQKDAKDIGTLIVATRNEFMFPKGYKDKSGVISFVDRRVAMEMAETYKESWRRRDITNFEYLMRLNTLAGRTYNDLTQYPVFPWVLADYSSESLDFNKSSTFRDLTKPVGALDSKRFEVFEDRYRSFSDPDIPNFYYGSHYSSMGIVLFYLLRLEPFTSLHRSLQGGKFDHADRLFQSIEGTYRNCLSNTSDVKELVPEFFYMPEFLLNLNSYHFGVKQDGKPLADVCLPPWAKGSPEEFVSKNREALESEYVSSNLHHWIDLVFGYKQRGKPAVEAANIFYYLTYEGAVDLDTVEDELQRSAIEDQIANFGQTPIQIFRKKHPRRGPPIPIAHPLRFSPDSISLTSIVSSTSDTPSAVVHVGVLDSNIVLVNQGLSMSVKIWLTPQLQSGGNFTFSSTQDPIFGIGSDILSSRKIGSPLAEFIELGSQCFATMQTTPENFLISCGNWENSFQVISLTDGRTVQSIRQHKDIVSCVAVTSDGSILATGSYDTTIMVWDVVRARTPERRVRNAPTVMPRKDYVIAETPFHILCGHDDVITCLYVSAELDTVISGSKDGTCIFHTLREGRYVRSLRHPSGSPLSKLVGSCHGRIVFYADEDLSLHLYSINGKHLATSESNGRLNCVELSSCGEFLLCAGDHGQIVVRSMKSLEVVRRYDGVGKIITSLTVTQEECFLAGTKDGSLLVYSIENPQLCRTTVPRNLKFRACVR